MTPPSPPTGPSSASVSARARPAPFTRSYASVAWTPRAPTPTTTSSAPSLPDASGSSVSPRRITRPSTHAWGASCSGVASAMVWRGPRFGGSGPRRAAHRPMRRRMTPTRTTAPTTDGVLQLEMSAIARAQTRTLICGRSSRHPRQRPCPLESIMADTRDKQTIYSVYWLYRADPAFHRLAEGERQAAKAAFLAALEGRDQRVTLRGVYSLVGLRADADLLLWAWGPDLDALQRLGVTPRPSALGRSLIQVETYVGVVSVPRYDPEHGPAFVTGAPPKQYVSVY